MNEEHNSNQAHQEELFQKENGMTRDEAWDKVREWHFSGDTDAAKRGCQIILEYFPDHEARELVHKMESAESLVQKAENTLPRSSKKPSLLSGLFGKKQKKEPSVVQDVPIPQTESPLPDYQASPEESDSIEKVPVLDDERLFATISYAWIFCIIPLFLKKDSMFVQFHAKQGLIMALLFTIFEFTIGAFFQVVFPFIGVLIRFTYIGLIFYAAYQAYQGRSWRIPLIYGLSQKIKL